MKQYTTTEQTAKLIELGFEKPRYYSADKYTIIHTGFDIINYSIGELIEILENAVQKDNFITDLDISCDEIAWIVRYISEGVGRFKTQMPDLIDALYDMVVKLKEEGVI